MATIDAPPVSSTGQPAKKSLRSKRLMRPAPGGAKAAAALEEPAAAVVEEPAVVALEEAAVAVVVEEPSAAKEEIVETTLHLTDTETVETLEVQNRESRDSVELEFVEANSSSQTTSRVGSVDAGGLTGALRERVNTFGDDSAEFSQGNSTAAATEEVEEEVLQRVADASPYVEASARMSFGGDDTIKAQSSPTQDAFVVFGDIQAQPRDEGPLYSTWDSTPQDGSQYVEDESESLIQLLSSTSDDVKAQTDAGDSAKGNGWDDDEEKDEENDREKDRENAAVAGTIPPQTIPEPAIVAEEKASGRAPPLALGRSGSVRGSKAGNRRSIMLTSFVPPVGMGSGSSTASTRSSGEDGEKSDAASIRLRPSADSAGAKPPLASIAEPALASIAEKAETDGGAPAWVREVQRRKQEAAERAETEKLEQQADPPSAHPDLPHPDLSQPDHADHPPAPPPKASSSFYRSLSASLGMGSSNNSMADNSPDPRQRSASQASGSTQASPAAVQAGGGLFAAVTSFFGRASTQASAPEAAAIRAESAADPATDDLLSQLEAQNAQILGDTKARVFALSTEPTPSASEPPDGEPSDDADWDFWGRLISDYDRVARAEPRRLARAVHSGIPPAIRGTVWQLVSGARGDAAVTAAFPRLLAASSGDHDRAIAADLARTFPRSSMFGERGGAGQEGLRAVLRAYAAYDSGVGYCQGLAFVAATLLAGTRDAGEAFGVLARLMAAYGLRAHYVAGMDDLHLRLFQLDHVLHATLPRLARHLADLRIEPATYATPWLMTLFACRLPLNLALRVADVVLAEGLDALLRVAVAVLRRAQTRVLALGDAAAVVRFFNDGPLFAFYAHAAPDALVRDANDVTAVTPRLLRSLRRRYVDETQRRIDQADESTRMIKENERLVKDNERLIKDNERLASQAPSVPPAINSQDFDRLAQKNAQLVLKNQQLEDALHDVEAALIQIKVLYAESENDRAVLAMKLEGLRKALT
ncbi:GTPase-activating protein [Coemansia thaxteri]|uniref:GTPase-activating protein n=1 Tax=Coemansia thaxteri TaxID=2663907 RepID=A0A9W8BM39_9FUNG|nr:GTPase-activating protein [Coemansia thaxteri]KAJ2008915.1 GTPase-activating protein [Coemansia thaxteri]KAJ2473531.1 GTPase-activating protein [Coemansia sp. RSA 2322]KAJ2487914.1 GTPase-activating protein [Coemansia sp. RSA 2320]